MSKLSYSAEEAINHVGFSSLPYFAAQALIDAREKERQRQADQQEASAANALKRKEIAKLMARCLHKERIIIRIEDLEAICQENWLAMELLLCRDVAGEESGS
jgi:hypothetical protein